MPLLGQKTSVDIFQPSHFIKNINLPKNKALALILTTVLESQLKKIPFISCTYLFYKWHKDCFGRRHGQNHYRQKK